MSEFQKISSPEQLNNYIRVTASYGWLILAAILLFFGGFFTWIFYGELELSFPRYIYTDDKNSFAYVNIDQISVLKDNPDVIIRIPGTVKTGKISKISLDLLRSDEIIDEIGEYSFVEMGLNERDKLFKVSLDFNFPVDAIVRAFFVIGKIKPLSFLLKN